MQHPKRAARQQRSEVAGREKTATPVEATLAEDHLEDLEGKSRLNEPRTKRPGGAPEEAANASDADETSPCHQASAASPKIAAEKASGGIHEKTSGAGCDLCRRRGSAAGRNANVGWIAAKLAEVVEEHTCEEAGRTELSTWARTWIHESSEEARLPRDHRRGGDIDAIQPALQAFLCQRSSGAIAVSRQDAADIAAVWNQTDSLGVCLHTKLQASLNYADGGMHNVPRVLGSMSDSAACNNSRAEADAALDSQELGDKRGRTAGKLEVSASSRQPSEEIQRQRQASSVDVSTGSSPTHMGPARQQRPSRIPREILAKTTFSLDCRRE